IHDHSSSGATLWVEPLKTVEANNEYRELQLEEEKEIRRILRELCDLVAHEADYIVRTVNVLSYLDLTFAKANYADAIRASAPQLVGFDVKSANPLHPGVALKLIRARHPLLDSAKVVPIDVEFNEDSYALVITGPNTGGKTVALKTIGLMVLMSQCGMHIPADEGSVLSVFENIYADIGDEQSIEQSLSTFSGHMTNIIGILAQANDRSLVILDELGAGTDPAEGSALARAILSRLLDEGVTTMVTSHHPELKIYAQERRGLRNASVEFDLKTLAPTYRLIMGLPGRSNALAIATRLGLPEDIIDDAKSMVATEDLVADDLLDEITRTREETRTAYERAEQIHIEAEAMRENLRHEYDRLESERRDILAEARRKADYEISELRKELKRVRQDMQTARQPLETIKQLEKSTDHMGIDIDSVDPLAPEIDDDVKSLRIGDNVWISRLQSEGQIMEMSAGGDVEVAIGQMRVRTGLHELEYRKTRKKKAQPERTSDPLPEVGKSPGLELDLRGARVEEALERVR
ncbi:MAG TPA: MutS2/Smr-associated SH3 domain-containing protein, partial [Aggregatilineales bacterium]|nr:MutS2/Smr-associated SH3 domain-containing protein [Aggregatilineales bacterium]